jgi:hypothetical protein
MVDGKRVENTPVALEYTSRGHLLPCCWLDAYNHEKKQALEEAGLLKEELKLIHHPSVKSVMMSREWVEFHRILLEEPEKSLGVCKLKCGADKSEPE